MITPFFTIAIQKHQMLGFTALPFFAFYENSSGFYQIESNITLRDKESDKLTQPQAEAVKMCETFYDTEILRRFARTTKFKGKNIWEFFRSLPDGYLENYIQPFISKKLGELLLFLKDTTIPVFLRENQAGTSLLSQQLSISEKETYPEFNFHYTSSGIHYQLQLRQEDSYLSLQDGQRFLLTESPLCSLVIKDQIYLIPGLDGKKLKPFLSKKNLFIPADLVEKYMKNFIFKTLQKHHVVATGFEINYSDMAPQPILTLTRDLRNQTCFRLTFLYEKNEIDNNYPFSKIVTLIHHQTSYGFRVYHRNRQKEQKIIEKLQNLHLHETAGYYYLKESNPLNIINWLNNWAAALKEFGFSIHQKDLTTNYYIGSFQLRVRAERKNADWFDVYALVEIDDNTIPFLSFRNYIRQGRRDFMLPDGKVFVIPEAWFERFTDVMAFATKSKKGDDNHFLLRPYHIPLLSKATQQKLTGDGLDRLQRFFESPIQTNVPVPVSLKAILRNYQQEGLSWLKHLHDNNFGGCLADDMGLGKTLQTLALILLTKQNIPSQTVENGQMNLFDSRPVSIIPSLIIVPTSLIHNWALEIQKFAPTLRWLTYTGKRDHLPRKFNSHDIIITSYGIARNDIAVLKKYSFHYVVLDESQFVKNHESKTYRALLKLQSAHKLVLTGTPIENSLKDLWSQLNFLNRGLLGTHQDFVERYVIPIERYQDEEKKEKLQHLIRPFLLRRKKSEVAKELPPVTEQVLWCEMTEEQADRYERYKSGIRNNLIDQLEDQNLHQEQMQVLEALLRLRQMANHPVLADETYSGDSGKFDEVVRIVSNIVAENHKILIFSSFVQHLKLFAHNFEQQQLPYSMLTGATTDRQSAVNNFQQDENKRVFLISLKAGGTGLNLTRADYVILLDPWWNPAAEQQALSRAHRIGQDKKVFVFKMITRNTIEEKIYALQQRKTKLAETFVNSNNPFKNMSAAEIQALFD